MIYVAMGMLLLGTLNGWGARALWYEHRKAQRIRRIVAELKAEPLAPIDAIDYIEVEFFEGKPKVTLLPQDFDGRA